MPPKLKNDDEEEAEEEQVEDEEEEEEIEEEQTEEEEDDEGVETEEVEDVEVAEVERPGDEDEDESRGSLTSGTTFGISNKFLLLAGLGAVLLVFYLKFIRARANSTTKSYDSEEAEEEVQQAMNDNPDGEVHIEKDDRDPLGADEQALDYVFEDQQ